MLSHWSSNSPRRGLTLVEVVAGIALLSTLLVLTLASFRAHTAQVRGTKARMAAIRAADELLSEWFSGAGVPPAGQGGEVTGHPGWTWRTVPVASTKNPQLSGTLIVKLEILGDRNTPGDSVLSAVELLVSAPTEGRP